ncbi:MAG TPA: patatin-like phospholipase family protein [Saprospiraceae bacterium]|nr:patatin-like phospholipase family protein [Saprospiraceae bacterium]HMP25355.1 patatin-like phospholipase family protein [Saprospiraceae bacterium]
MELGLVMSGGGTRGAYQMGVWRALRELGLEPYLRVATGASIGAINGALVAGQDWEQALELWQSVQPHQVFNSIASEFSYTTLLREWWQHGGIRVDGLKELIRTHVDEATLRRSEVDFGLVVYNRTTRQGEALYPEDIPEGLLAEYVIASATFPVFQPHRIGAFEYIDGGIYSILPTKMAFERRDLDLVIAVDVAEASRFSPQQWQWHRQYADRLVYVRPSRLLPSPMNFSKKAFQQQLALGYADGLKKLSPIAEKVRIGVL